MTFNNITINNPNFNQLVECISNGDDNFITD